MSGMAKTIAVWTGCIAPTAALNVLPHGMAIAASGMATPATLIPHLALATVKAAMVVGMAYLPMSAREAETRWGASCCWLVWVVVASVCFFHAMEGAGSLRDGLAAPARDRQSQLSGIESRVARYTASRDRVPQHAPATAAMVEAAKKRVADATTARDQECGKVGDNCRKRVTELDEASADLGKVEERRGYTEQLEGWDAKIDAAEKEKGALGRVEDHADQGAARAAVAINFTLGWAGAHVTEAGVTEGWPIWLAIALELWAGLGPSCFLRRKKIEVKPEPAVENREPEGAVQAAEVQTQPETGIAGAPAGSDAGVKRSRPARPAASRKPKETKVAGPATVLEWHAATVRQQEDAPDQQAKVFHDGYVRYCEARGWTPVAIQVFGRIMKKELKVDAYDKSKRTYYRGIVMVSAPKLAVVNG